MREFECRRVSRAAEQRARARAYKENIIVYSGAIYIGARRGRAIYIKSYRETSGSGRFLQMAPEL